MAFVSQEYEEISIFEDLLLAHSSANFQQFVSNRLPELEQNLLTVMSRRIIIVFVIAMSLYL